MMHGLSNRPAQFVRGFKPRKGFDNYKKEFSGASFSDKHVRHRFAERLKWVYPWREFLFILLISLFILGLVFSLIGI